MKPRCPACGLRCTEALGGLTCREARARVYAESNVRIVLLLAAAVASVVCALAAIVVVLLRAPDPPQPARGVTVDGVRWSLERER